MPKMIAYCGLVCSDCPTFIATQNNDDEAREKTAAFYAQKFGLNLKPEDINCDGCKSEGGKLIGYCLSCEIRRCCREKGLENCARCDDQPCEKLTQFHEFSIDAKTSFEALKINAADSPKKNGSVPHLKRYLKSSGFGFN